jgi:ATP-dependent DNA helicase RecG
MADAQMFRGADAFGLPAATRVLTPKGWMALDQLAVGDRLVDVQGRSCVVRRVVLQAAGPAFDVRLADGTVTTAGAGQLWPVEVGRGASRIATSLSTTQVADAVGVGTSVRLVRSRAVQMPGIAPLILRPALLGLLLGDGGMSSGTAVTLWTTEPELRRRAEEALPPGARFSDHPSRQPRCTGWAIIGEVRRRGGNPVLNGLRLLGLSGAHSWTKSVPDPYLWAPIADRHALLVSLLDTDGAADERGRISFSSASPDLAAAVAHLVRSLGGRCTQHVRENVTYTIPNEGARPARPSYRVGAIALPDFSPFSLSRKAVRVRRVAASQLWGVRSVTPAGVQPLLAVEVDSPSATFIVENFVPVGAYVDSALAAASPIAA